MDSITPVAAEIQPPNPNQSLQTWAGILGIKQQQQQLQTGQYVQQQEQGAAQQQQQLMSERQKLQQFMANPTDSKGAKLDPDSDNYGSQVADWARGNLPLLGNSVAQAALKTQTDKVALRSSVADLQQKYRTGLGGVVASFVNAQGNGAQIGKQADQAIDEYVRANPDAMESAYHVKNLIDNLDNVNDPGKRAEAFNHLAAELQGVPSQKAGLQDTGTYFQSTATPAFGTGTVPVGESMPKSDIITLSNSQQARLNKETGQYELLTQGGGKKGGTQGNAKGPLTADTDPMNPGPNTALGRQNNYWASVDRATKDVQTAQDADANYGTNMATADRIRSLSNNATTGPGTQSWISNIGAIGTRLGAKENVADTQTLASFLDLQSARLRDSMGLPPTNAGLATSKEMGTSIESQKNAIQAKTDFYQAMTELNHRYRTGLDAAGNKGVNASPTAVNNFKSEFTKNADPIAMELRLAHDRGDQDAFSRILNSVPPQQRKALAAKGRYLDQLMGSQ
jgi:hypothetical protein